MSRGDHFRRGNRQRTRWFATATAVFAVAACGGSNNDDLLSHSRGGNPAGTGASGGFTGGATVSRGGDSTTSGGSGMGAGPSAGSGGDAAGSGGEGGAETDGGSSQTGGVGGRTSGGASATGGKGNAGGGAVSGGAGGTSSGGTSGGAGGKVSGGTSGASAGGKSGGTGGSTSGGQAGASGGGTANAGAGGAPTCSGKCDTNAECKVSGNTASCVCNEGYVGNGRTCARPISCRELHEATPSLPSGAYTLRPSSGNNEFSAYCEMTAEGGGWTLVLNEGTSFTPSTQGSKLQCFRQDCTSLAYSRVPIVSDVMLDVRDGAIVANNYLARVVVTGVEAGTRNRTVRELFNDGPYYLEKEDNSNLVVRLSGNGTCADSLPSDFAALVCSSCAAGDDCSAPVITFGDTDPGCVDDPDYAFAIGGSDSYTAPWGNCAGWPQTPDVGDFNYYPHNFRVWVR